MNNNKKITIIFNIGVMIYLFFYIGAIELFEPVNKEKVFFDLLFDSVPPFIGYSLAIFLALFALIIGTLIIKEFWNRFVSDIFKLRDINFQETLAISLILGCFGI